MKKEDLKKILSRFDKARILVIGDLILDEYIWGQAQRISPEAPVPVVWARSRSYMPGGASNVANNISSLGSEVTLCGVLGDDNYGKLLLEKFRDGNINSDGIIVDQLRPTTLKTRIIAAHQQVVRVDWEETGELSSAQSQRILEVVNDNIRKIDAIIIEDYGKGTVSSSILKKIIALAKKYKKIVTVDPKIEHFSCYKGVTAITPNEKEASEAAGIKVVRDGDIDKIGDKLKKRLGCKAVLVTLGEKGMKLFSDKSTTHIPTVAREVFDVSGAGDTVIAVFTLALCCGAKMQDAAMISNLAAGIVVGKIGAAVVTKTEIVEAFSRLVKYHKI